MGLLHLPLVAPAAAPKICVGQMGDRSQRVGLGKWRIAKKEKSKERLQRAGLGKVENSRQGEKQPQTQTLSLQT